MYTPSEGEHVREGYHILQERKVLSATIDQPAEMDGKETKPYVRYAPCTTL